MLSMPVELQQIIGFDALERRDGMDGKAAGHIFRGLLKGGLGEGCFQMAVALQFVLASATAMLVPFLASLANPPTRSAKATICVFAKRVVHSGAISSLFCKMSPTRCGQFDMSFGSENTRSKSPPLANPEYCCNAPWQTAESVQGSTDGRGFLYGAGAETLIFVKGRVEGKFCDNVAWKPVCKHVASLEGGGCGAMLHGRRRMQEFGRKLASLKSNRKKWAKCQFTNAKEAL